MPWRLGVRRLHDQAAARALKPDVPVINAAVENTAAPMLGHERHQGVEDFRHGAGRLSRP